MIRILKQLLTFGFLLHIMPNYAMETLKNDIPTMPLPDDALNIMLSHLDETDDLVDRIHFLSTCKGFYEYGWTRVHEKYPHMHSVVWHQLWFPTIREFRHFNTLITLAMDHFLQFSDLLGRSYSEQDLKNHTPILKQSCKLFDSILTLAQTAQDSYFIRTQGAFSYMTGFNWFENGQEQPLIPLLRFLKNYAEGNILYRGQFAGEATNNILQDPRRASRIILESSPMLQIFNTDYEKYLKQYCHRVSELHERNSNKVYPAEFGLHALFSCWIGLRDCKNIDGNKEEYIVLKRPRPSMVDWTGLNGNFVSYFAYEFPDIVFLSCHPHFQDILLSKAKAAPK